MWIPERLYRPTPKELMSTQVQFIGDAVLIANTATQLDFTLVAVPMDRTLLLNSFMVDVTPGATQKVTEVKIYVNLFGAKNIFIGDSYNAGGLTGAGARGFLAFTTTIGSNIILPANSTLMCSIIFDAGTNANAATVHYTGLLIPRGGIAV